MYKMTTVYHWKYWCETEGTYVYSWSPSRPTTCSTNSSHTISAVDSGFLRIGQVSSNEVAVREEYIKTAGLFQATQKSWDIPASVGPHTLAFDAKDFPTNVFSASFVSTADHMDDVIDVCVGHKTIVGVLTADASIGATTLSVSSTVLDNCFLGEEIYLTDGVNEDCCGIIVAKDALAGQITVKTATVNSFTAASPTYVKKTNYLVKDFTIGFPWKYSIGGDKIGGSYVPTGTIIEFHYTNTSATAKKFYAQYNYLHG